jgi:hypothetical protein
LIADDVVAADDIYRASAPCSAVGMAVNLNEALSKVANFMVALHSNLS